MYDIGSVPRRIVDTGDYLYLLTDTRLYVLRDDEFHALVDIFDGGDLIVAQTSFGLLEKKRLRWFREDGRYLGSVLSKDPIRRVYSKDEAMIVETRQRRMIAEGVPSWWGATSNSAVSVGACESLASPTSPFQGGAASSRPAGLRPRHLRTRSPTLAMK